MSSKDSNSLDELFNYMGRIVEDLDHLTEMRENENFDNPFVLSLLSNFVVPNSFVPDRYLFSYELNRIPFSFTGKSL